MKENSSRTPPPGYQMVRPLIIFVLECDDGQFGQDCLQSCSPACKHICHKVTGHCDCGNITNVSPRCESCPSNCDSGCYDDLECVACKSPFYSTSCSSVCSPNCRIGGRHGCYRDGSCDECDDGHYGIDCEKSCPENCLNSTCSKEEGTCIGKAGFTGTKCEIGINIFYFNSIKI